MWGTACGGDSCENIVWGTAMDLENIVWGTADTGENIVWGTNDGSREHRVGHRGRFENIVWGTSADEDVTWGSSGEDCDLFDDPSRRPVNYDATPLDESVPTTCADDGHRLRQPQPATREEVSNGEDAFP